jgi:hypothetical protein
MTNCEAIRQLNLDFDHRVEPSNDAWRKGFGPAVRPHGLRTLMKDARGQFVERASFTYP